MTDLQTARLTLRPLGPADAADYAVMRYHPEVAKWLNPGQRRSGRGPPRQHWPLCRAVGGTRLFAVAILVEERLIGHCGLNHVPEFEATEVLWALQPDGWGKGYATEAARAAVGVGGLPAIFAITGPDNLSSLAVVKRLGLGYRRNVTYRGFEARWFDITREAWSAPTPGRA